MPAGNRPRIHARRPTLLALIASLGALCVFAAACAKAPLEHDKPCWLAHTCEAPPLSPDANPTELPFDAPLEGNLHCDEGDCQNWYRVGVSQDGPIEIELRAVPAGGHGSIALALLDEHGDILFQQERPSQRIQRRVPAGSYQLGVVTVGTRGRPLRYQVVAVQPASLPIEEVDAPIARLGGAAARHAWAPGRSQSGWIQSEVVEVEANSVGILIDAGTARGLRAGQRGELVQAGQTIARIELVEVYEAGSRARLLGPATNPIDPLKTVARIHVAPASRAR